MAGDDVLDFASRYQLSEEALSELQSLVSREETSRERSAEPVLEGDSAATLAGWAMGSGTATETFTDVLPSRYTYLDDLGSGGMGMVRRVRDGDLNRVVAMKIIRAELTQRVSVLHRFVQEAQATAQLEHPGIVPIYDLGRLADGRLFFTMPEIRGRTFAEVIANAHGDRADTQWSLRRLVGAFHQVCEAMAYAHSRGVVHRDLKPSNVMLGAFGEVLVLDWGLAKLVGQHTQSSGDEIETQRSLDASQATRMGAVAGTPAYMPPEQARGSIDEIDARADVYALGAILYELLAGVPPYSARADLGVLEQVLGGPPTPLSELTSRGSRPSGVEGVHEVVERGPLWVDEDWPEALVQCCQRAMERDKRERHADAGVLAHEVLDWLEGADRRAKGLKLVAEARSKQPEADALTTEAAALRAQAEQDLQAVEPWMGEDVKGPAWALQDRATALERQAAIASLQTGHLLHGALVHAPELIEANRALASGAREAMSQALLRADEDAALSAEVALRSHLARLPATDPARHEHEAFLEGDGHLTLVTEPAGAEVTLFRYERENRRLRPGPARHLGRTPLSRVELAKGSYLLKIQAAGRVEVTYPVHIGPQEHWDGVAPGETEPTPVYLPRPEELREGEVYVPAGWFWLGGDDAAAESLPKQRVWMHAYCIGRQHITNREYLEFLEALVSEGREEEAVRQAPSMVENPGSIGNQVYLRDADGHFRLPTSDDTGNAWLADYPVYSLDWVACRGYAAWRAARDSLPYRLAFELEWSKAGRGVDGRHVPWGDFVDESWACLKGSRDGQSLPAETHEFPVDASPYGVRHLAGNAMEWCADIFVAEGPAITAQRADVGHDIYEDPEDPLHVRVVRSCSWRLGPKWSRLANRYGVSMSHRANDIGFRLARPFVRET
ncbi:MAG: SUMF1/EgtB/PvdO family nonheme iron enzyme [Proteobacteria bacterium]|nr:SUMF1/EgtB/PvdO family nonheme iron enzyme [Pseudomonadota bacterium]